MTYTGLPLADASIWGSALLQGWKWAVPDFNDKTPYDSSNAWIIASPLPLIALQIHLLIRYDPWNTWLLRASLVPFIILLCLRFAFAHYYRVTGEGQLDGRGQHVQITLGCGAFSVMTWALGWGLTLRRPRLRIDRAAVSGSSKTTCNGETDVRDIAMGKLPTFFPGTWWPLELDLLLNIRGLGWEHGVKDSAPALPVRTFTVRERWVWIAKNLAPVPLYYLLYDAFFVLIEDSRFNVHAHTRYGGSIWDCKDSAFGRAGPYLICLTYASTFVSVQYMAHAVMAALAIALLNDKPSRWDPPAVRFPWISSSVREFWNYRWHQYLRATFMTLGFWPIRNVLSPVIGRHGAFIAAVCGAFLASGIIHDLGRVTLAPTPGWAITEVCAFFAVQPIAIFGEELWEYLTGRKVRGFVGWAWTVSWMLITSPLLFETMNRDGMLASENMTFAITQKPVTAMLEWYVATFGQ